jgi:cytoskeletal protein RodZ
VLWLLFGAQNVENKNEFRITTLSRGLTVAPPSQTETTAPVPPAAAPAAPAVPTADTAPTAAVTSSYTVTVDSNAEELLKIRKKADAVESAQGGIPLLAILRPYSHLADYIEVRTASP